VGGNEIGEVAPTSSEQAVERIGGRQREEGREEIVAEGQPGGEQVIVSAVVTPSVSISMATRPASVCPSPGAPTSPSVSGKTKRTHRHPAAVQSSGVHPEPSADARVDTAEMVVSGLPGGRNRRVTSLAETPLENTGPSLRDRHRLALERT